MRYDSIHLPTLKFRTSNWQLISKFTNKILFFSFVLVSVDQWFGYEKPENERWNLKFVAAMICFSLCILFFTSSLLCRSRGRIVALSYMYFSISFFVHFAQMCLCPLWMSHSITHVIFLLLYINWLSFNVDWNAFFAVPNSYTYESMEMISQLEYCAQAKIYGNSVTARTILHYAILQNSPRGNWVAANFCWRIELIRIMHYVNAPQ